MTNLILATDSYKTSHWKQYPKHTEIVSSYIEARGFDKELVPDGDILFYGLQGILKAYLEGVVLTQEMIEEAKAIIPAHIGTFNLEGWQRLLDKWRGKLPIQVYARLEGEHVNPGTPLVVIENTDPEFYWLTSYLEPMLMRLWYPITVASVSAGVKNTLREFWSKTSDEPADSILFKLHDFGARGVSSAESAAIGGAAHLVNFLGSDTMEALLYLRKYYGAKDVAGFSIPAAEHSTITTWGKEGEAEAYRNMLTQYGGKGKLLAVVSDSYDVYNACEKIWGEELRDEVIRSGATVVIRPDSGDPCTVVRNCLDILGRKFGYTTNSKGFKVLNHVRLIQGDGVNPTSIKQILIEMYKDNWSIDNIAFGMGGALLQKVHRDTLKFAMKCSAMRIDGRWIDVYKDPVTDPGKTSKRGRQVTDGMALIFKDGNMERETDLHYVRARSNG